MYHIIVAIIELKKVSKIYKTDPTQTAILNNISLKINSGEFVAVMGPSGSGKSTLLNIIGLLDKPTSGRYILDGEEIIARHKSTQLAFLRRKKIGFIFQSFNLLARVSALTNVELPMVYSKLVGRRQRAEQLLQSVGLDHRIYYKPNQLSGGEQQRVAIARALANKPKILLCDEPTGNLDSRSGKNVINILKKLNDDGQTIIVVTHDKQIAQRADRIIKMADGRIVK